MATYSTTKRFLAGAVCPRCEAADRIQVYSENDRDYRECVACGFKDEMHFTGSSRELDTRVNISSEEKKAEFQPVKIIDLNSPKH